MGEINKKELLDEVILKEFNNLKTLTPGSKEHSAAAEDICKLYRLHLEELNGDTDFTEKSNRLEAEMNMRERELELKEKQVNEESELKNKELMVKSKDLELRSRELDIREKQFDQEHKLKTEEFKESRRDRAMDEVTDRKRFRTELIKWGVGIGVTILLNELKDKRFANWLAAGLKFEEEGTFTSKTFMGFIHNIKPSGCNSVG